MERHFANWGAGVSIDVQRLDRSPKGLAEYRAEPGKLTFLSSVNFMLAREAWERVPFRPVPYAEDQLLGRELIEAGYAKVFQPEARSSCTRITFRRAISCAGTSTSTAGCARCSTTGSRRSPGTSCARFGL